MFKMKMIINIWMKIKLILIIKIQNMIIKINLNIKI